MFNGVWIIEEDKQRIYFAKLQIGASVHYIVDIELIQRVIISHFFVNINTNDRYRIMLSREITESLNFKREKFYRLWRKKSNPHEGIFIVLLRRPTIRWK
jgi:hypothetical protein